MSLTCHAWYAALIRVHFLCTVLEVEFMRCFFVAARSTIMEPRMRTCTFREDEAMMRDASPVCSVIHGYLRDKTEKLIHKSLGINEVEV